MTGVSLLSCDALRAQVVRPLWSRRRGGAASEQYKLDDSIDEVQPTFSAHVSVLFDVAADAHRLTLVNAPAFDSGTHKLFTLGD
jgi:hypothetical protein